MDETGRLTGASSWPQRTCVGCRATGDRSTLLRVVAPRASTGPNQEPPGSLNPDRDGAVVLIPDTAARLPGRGAWLHVSVGCLELARRRRAFGRALRLSVPVDLSAVEAEIVSRSGN